ncbi:hypothetical protein [Nitratireductor thuwali]|uniref:Uncharacterized protein n=1 Tax=Nitratireductor thuwali TaxID=2267699 RepID=A0ABY5MNC6_9HYPH|nr:hypothetical protein NTH_03403 [Nitratireductor thuwali]
MKICMRMTADDLTRTLRAVMHDVAARVEAGAADARGGEYRRVRRRAENDAEEGGRNDREP